MVTQLGGLIDVLPEKVADWARGQTEKNLTEIFLHCGRPVRLRYGRGVWLEMPDYVFSLADVEETLTNIGGGFDQKNRAALGGELHRIACLRNSDGRIVGFTIRVSHHVEGLEKLLLDVLNQNNRILLIGRPGSGKTTMLRNLSKYLSSVRGMNVVVVDLSNEIGGNGDTPHPCLGDSLRLQVPHNRSHASVIVEAIENHGPDYVVVDEVSNREDARAVRSGSERGVSFVATVHGNNLKALLNNTELGMLIGNVKSSTLGDDEANRRGLSRKTVLERELAPAFDVVVELRGFDEVGVYPDAANAIDAILYGKEVTPEIRRMHDGNVVVLSHFSITETKPIPQQLYSNGSCIPLNDPDKQEHLNISAFNKSSKTFKKRG